MKNHPFDFGVLLEQNLIEQVKFYSTSSLTKFYDDHQAIRFVTGLPISNLNLIAGAKLPDNNINHIIENALEPFKEEKVPMIWWVGPSSKPDNLGFRLEKCGFKKVFDMVGMYYELEKFERKIEFPITFTAKPVDNNSLLRIWAETQTLGFEGRATDTKYFYEFEKSLGTDLNSPWVRFIGFIKEDPVAVSILFKGTNVGAIFNVATAPKFRRRGIGTIMTRILLDEAKSLGYKFAVLKATPIGVNLYRSMNFSVCGKIGLYHTSFM